MRMMSGRGEKGCEAASCWVGSLTGSRFSCDLLVLGQLGGGGSG